jgi:hypothetical protein
MTTAAMNVFPRPVGNATRVFLSKHFHAISRWYLRSGKLLGYTYLPRERVNFKMG